MINEIIDILLACAEGAFLQVGVFVGAVLLLFGYINYRQEGKFVARLENAQKWQPILGALLGLTPGCGGAIFVMPLYLKGSVTFGTIIATLIATMGDSAFVLISTQPLTYLYLSIISFVVAILTGYIVDHLKIDGGFAKQREKRLKELRVTQDEHNEFLHNQLQHVGHAEGDEVDVLLHHNAKGSVEGAKIKNFTHKYAYKIFWSLTCVGLVLGILLLFQIDINTKLIIPQIGKVIGIGGTLFSLVYMLLNKKVLQNAEHEKEEEKMFSLKEMLVHNAEDTAFVNTWVFIAYVIYEVAVYAVGGATVVQSWMMAAGLLSVFIGAMIGLIPGCGPQIIFITLYTRGMLPFAALLANAISQDGDALFPLLAIDLRSSLWATIITTIPALLVGVVWYFAAAQVF